MTADGEPRDLGGLSRAASAKCEKATAGGRDRENVSLQADNTPDKAGRRLGSSIKARRIGRPSAQDTRSIVASAPGHSQMV